MITKNLTGDLEDSICITSARWDDGGPFITEVNEAFTRLTGYSEQEVLDRNPKFLQGAGSSRLVLSELKQKCMAGEYFQGVTINYRKDGVPFVMEWCINPIRGRSGIILFYIAIQRDGSVTYEKTLDDASITAIANFVIPGDDHRR